MDTDSETGSPGEEVGGDADPSLASCFLFKLVLSFSAVTNTQQPAVGGGSGVFPSCVCC